MRLFKMIDIVDVESIRKEGILPASRCGNYNWFEKRRAENTYDVVYMFVPCEEHRVFPNYGCALAVCEISEPQRIREIQSVGRYADEYLEFVVDEVKPEEILGIYVPKVLGVFEGTIPCEMDADIWDEEPDDLETFAKTARVTDTKEFNYFRGMRKDGTMIDLRNVRYYV